MARTNYDHVPGPRGNFLEGSGEADLSKDCGGCGHTGSIHFRDLIAKRKVTPIIKS
jgi:hypothetical protein